MTDSACRHFTACIKGQTLAPFNLGWFLGMTQTVVLTNADNAADTANCGCEADTDTGN